MPLVTPNRITFEEVDPPRRLVYKNMVEFIPDVAPYEVETVLELDQAGDSVHLVITFEAMHDEAWTQMAVMGHNSELRKLEQLLAANS